MSNNTATAPKLYELNDEFSHLAAEHLELVEEIEERGGEATDEELYRIHDIENRLNEICLQSDLKILDIARMCAEREVEIARLKAEEERIRIFAESAARRRKHMERSNEFFEKYSLHAMHIQGKREVTDGVNTLKIRESKRVEVTNIQDIPVKFLRGVNVFFGDQTPDADKETVFDTLNELNRSATSIKMVDKAKAKKALKDSDIQGLELKSHETLKFS